MFGSASGKRNKSILGFQPHVMQLVSGKGHRNAIRVGHK